MATWAIVAVAIGDRGKDRIIRDMTNLSGVRDYIPGLINGLGNLAQPYALGTDYEIDYRERTRSEIDTDRAEAFRNPSLADHIILGMSTTVVDAARKFTTAIKIVGIVSDPTHIIPIRNIC